MPEKEKRQNVNESLPLKVLLNKIKKVTGQAEKSIQIVFVLKGNLQIEINNNQYNLTETDVILINNEDEYVIRGEEDNLTLSIQIDYDFIAQVVRKDQFLFLCNSSVHENRNFDGIRKILAKIIYEYSNRQNGYEIQIMSLLYQLIYLLKINFLVTDSNTSHYLGVEGGKHSERIDNLLSYIKQNYRQPISLQDVANAHFLTPEYLSRFFKSHMGMNFSKYLNEFRLNHAVKELIRTQNSITKIAMNNGFPNLAAFIKIFKEVYNTTPSEYRNEVMEKKFKEKESKKVDLEVAKIDYNQALEKLSKYVSKETSLDVKSQFSSTDSVVNVKANINEQKTASHTWRNVINLGYAADGLRSDLQQHLTEIQKQIKFKYVRFQGILSDDMLIESEQRNDLYTYNFTKIDKMIDFIYSIGLKPFIELSNKAKVLNQDAENIMYIEQPSNKQRSLQEWKGLVERFIIHCVNRYGIEEVEQWYFEIWKEGEISHILWNGNFDDYMSIFVSYYKIIKGIVPNAKVGGPGINPEINLIWLNDLLEKWKSAGVIPDFLSAVFYPYELIEKHSRKNTDHKNPGEGSIYESAITSSKAFQILTTDKNYIKNYLDKIRKILDKSGVEIPEVHVTEWNSTVSHRHPANDTVFKAAFITKHIIDNLDGISSFGYWFCSDVSGELSDSKDLLYGDMGLISAQGVRKPGFYAYEMLAKLGKRLIKKGDGYIITSKSAHNYEIIAYNYKHFDHFYCLNEDTSISFDQYYNIFEDQKDVKLVIDLEGAKKGNYRIKKYTLNREHGSIFDEWLKMNVIHNIKQPEIEYLKQICVPEQIVWYERDTDHLNIESQLKPHEVNLFEITLEYN